MEYFISERQRIHAFDNETAEEDLLKAIRKQLGNDTTEAKIQTSSASKDWPQIGIDFLKKFRKKILKKLDFEEENVSDEEEIEEDHELDFWVTEKWYYGIGFNTKRSSNISVYWGLYSENERRDPKFRKLCQQIEENPDFIDEDDEVFFGEWEFEFNDEEVLGFETGDRIKISKLSDKEFFEEVLESFLELCEETDSLVEKYM